MRAVGVGLLRGIQMLPEPSYFAVVCSQCQRASLVRDDYGDSDSDRGQSSACVRCGAPNRAVPGASFIRDDVTLFAELERIVHHAQLSKREVALIAADLESVSLRWEPPELVLDRIRARLEGLRALYEPKQDYARLLLVVGMLLTIICARMVDDATAVQSSRPSGIRELSGEPETPGRRSSRQKRSTPGFK
jgi:hypothetical protein